MRKRAGRKASRGDMFANLILIISLSIINSSGNISNQPGNIKERVRERMLTLQVRRKPKPQTSPWAGSSPRTQQAGGKELASLRLPRSGSRRGMERLEKRKSRKNS
jgi:hypothetical protein